MSDAHETFLPAEEEPGPRARTIALGGGKGGVGKSFLTANLAASLAQAGFRVIAVDTDLEGANLHTCLGIPRPRATLADFVARREKDLGKLAVDTPVRNLRLVAGTDANLDAAQPRPALRVKLLRALRRLPADYVLLDLGAGVHPATIDYFLIGDDGLLVMAPEPTSVENAYAFLRAAFYRRLRLTLTDPAVRRVVNEAMDQRNERGIRTPIDLLREVERLDPAEGGRFVATMRGFRPRVVVNGVRSAEDVRLGFAVRSVCRKYFGLDADYLGYVNDDPAVRRAIAARRPVVLAEPRSDAAVYVGRIARKLAAEAGHAVPGRAVRRAAPEVR